ncbi:MAG TPA: hypothetical protein ENI23_14485 [bacterium]|nr:hypothetical protein [bacterium]
MTEPTAQNYETWNHTMEFIDKILADETISPRKRETFEFRKRAVQGLLDGKIYDAVGKDKIAKK